MLIHVLNCLGLYTYWLFVFRRSAIFTQQLQSVYTDARGQNTTIVGLLWCLWKCSEDKNDWL